MGTYGTAGSPKGALIGRSMDLNFILDFPVKHHSHHEIDMCVEESQVKKSVGSNEMHCLHFDVGSPQ